jgi:hypothetical protein
MPSIISTIPTLLHFSLLQADCARIAIQISGSGLGRIADFCARGLLHMKTQHLMHRDVTPPNSRAEIKFMFIVTEVPRQILPCGLQFTFDHHISSQSPKNAEARLLQGSIGNAVVVVRVCFTGL